MATRFFFLVAILSSAYAGLLHSSPSLVNVAPVVQTRVEPYDPHPQYSYAYSVNDVQTGDFKSQHESRNGDVVHGQYSLTDPDGSHRVVNYSAGPQTGFNAVVSRTAGVHPTTAVAAVSSPVARGYGQ